MGPRLSRPAHRAHSVRELYAYALPAWRNEGGLGRGRTSSPASAAARLSPCRWRVAPPAPRRIHLLRLKQENRVERYGLYGDATGEGLAADCFLASVATRSLCVCRAGDDRPAGLDPPSPVGLPSSAENEARASGGRLPRPFWARSSTAGGVWYWAPSSDQRRGVVSRDLARRRSSPCASAGGEVGRQSRLASSRGFSRRNDGQFACEVPPSGMRSCHSFSAQVARIGISPLPYQGVWEGPIPLRASFHTPRSSRNPAAVSPVAAKDCARELTGEIVCRCCSWRIV
jgi:hypothetical protein